MYQVAPDGSVRWVPDGPFEGGLDDDIDLGEPGPTTRNDPYGPGWDGQTRVQILLQSGYEWLEGSGPTAVWVSPQGIPVSEAAALNAIVPALSRPPTATANRAPDVVYDSTGKAFVYSPRDPRADPDGYVASPRFDDFTQAAGYRPPSQAQARQPQTTIGRGGAIFITGPDGFPQYVGTDERLAEEQRPSWQEIRDPATGRVTYFDPNTGASRDAGVFGYPSLSPEQQRAQEMQDAMTRRAWENEDRAAAAAERRAADQLQAEQAGMDRAQRASEFAAAHGLSMQRARLDAANTVAERISDTSPAAIKGFLAAGGGNVSNAIASGASALSADAMLGAARGLRSIDEQEAAEARRLDQERQYREDWYGTPGGAGPNNLNRPGYGPLAFAQPGAQGGPRPGFEFGVSGQRAGALGRAQALANDINRREASLPGYIVSAQPGLPPAAPSSPTEQRAGGFKWDPAGSGGISAFAYGTPGWIKAPERFVVNDANPDGDEERLEVRDPEGNAELRVMPHTSGAQHDRRAASVRGSRDRGKRKQAAPLPAFAYGTIEDPLGTGLVTKEDQPYIDRIRAIREGVDVRPPVAGGYYNVGFSRQAPTLQTSYFKALQDRYGIATQDTAAEADRYRLRGASRGAFSYGY